MTDVQHMDRLGWRRKIGVVTPSTNTIVEPEFHMMAPHGVTNHTARFLIPNMALNSNEDFEQLVVEIKANLDDAIYGLTPAGVHHIIVGISAESFWDGADGAEILQKRLEAKDAKTRKENLTELKTIAEDPERAKQFMMGTSMLSAVRRAATLG